MLKHGVELLNGFCMSAIIHDECRIVYIVFFCSHMLSGIVCINVHYLCSLLSPSGSDPEWSSNDEPGPLPRNPTPSHQPHCQQDSRCQVSPVPQVTFSPFPDSLHDWQVYQPIRIMLTLQCFGSYLISPFDSLKSGCSVPHISLNQSSQVIADKVLSGLMPHSCMHDVTWIIDHKHKVLMAWPNTQTDCLAVKHS